MKLKNPTSNYERQLLAIVEEYRNQIDFGKITLEISIKNNKLCLVEISSTKRTLKLD
jgi:hypothetical protein